MIADHLENIVCCDRNTMEFKTFVCILIFSDAQNYYYAHPPYKKKHMSI